MYLLLLRFPLMLSRGCSAGDTYATAGILRAGGPRLALEEQLELQISGAVVVPVQSTCMLPLNFAKCSCLLPVYFPLKII